MLPRIPLLLRLSDRPAPACLLGLVVLALGLGANAVLISTGDGTGNTSPPPDDPGFDNVGRAGPYSGVYLGGGYVLTASHVGAQSVTLLGTTYDPIPGSLVQIEHSKTENADLVVFRIDGAPPLPPLTVASASPSVGEEVVAVGGGYNRLPDLYAWNASWIEVPGSGTYRGFKRGTGAAIRWGRNEIDDVDLEFAVAGRVTRTFVTTFDEVGLPDEMQAVTKDSGGAVFVKRGGEWELAGILFLQSVYPGQPSNTAVFGNMTGAVDLSYYRDQIIAATNPQVPIPAGSLLGLAALLLATARPLLRRGSPARSARTLLRTTATVPRAF